MHWITANLDLGFRHNVPECIVSRKKTHQRNRREAERNTSRKIMHLFSSCSFAVKPFKKKSALISVPAAVLLGCICALNVLNLGLQLPLSWRETETGWDDGNICYSDSLFSQKPHVVRDMNSWYREILPPKRGARGTSRNRQHLLLGDRVKFTFLAFWLTFTGLCHWCEWLVQSPQG